MLDCVDVRWLANGRWWCNADDLPWLVRSHQPTRAATAPPPNSDLDGTSQLPADGTPAAPSASRWIDPDMVVPAPYGMVVDDRLEQDSSKGKSALDLHGGSGSLPMTNGTQTPTPNRAARRRMMDKFDEVDEETMSPLRWPSEPHAATVSTDCLRGCNRCRKSATASFPASLSSQLQNRIHYSSRPVISFSFTLSLRSVASGSAVLSLLFTTNFGEIYCISSLWALIS